jgi:hypothetical protein
VKIEILKQKKQKTLWISNPVVYLPSPINLDVASVLIFKPFLIPYPSPFFCSFTLLGLINLINPTVLTLSKSIE